MLTKTRFRICFITLCASALLGACGGGHDPNSVKKPKLIEFGAPLEAIESKLNSRCDTLESYPIDPPQFAGLKSQAQIDCTGFAYFGAKRDVEFVFVDGALAIAHINVEDSELPAIEQAFIDTLGTPTHSKDTVLVFADHNTAVRNNPTEVTFFAAFAAPSLIQSASIRPDRE
ncbi:hypothetical protein [Hirschia litorea]|uniref:Lipoprotein n=1 Tax=Hirschia litorea TaxID=1199156 RepID=A0ABW2ILF8_9PROT